MRRFAIAVLLLIATFAAAQVPGMTPFSGDMTMAVKNGHTMTGKMYVGNGKMRFDMAMGPHTTEMITDATNKVSYMVMPQQKMYMEIKQGQHLPGGASMPDLKSYDPNKPCSADAEVTCEKAGSETVNGRSTDKWIFKNKKSGNETTAWIDKKLHFAVRAVSGDVQTDLNNIKEGPQEASLFEIPSGFNKFDMSKMMGGRPPQ